LIFRTFQIHILEKLLWRELGKQGMVVLVIAAHSECEVAKESKQNCIFQLAEAFATLVHLDREAEQLLFLEQYFGRSFVKQQLSNGLCGYYIDPPNHPKTQASIRVLFREREASQDLSVPENVGWA
jgi:hypothetical protein